MTILRGRKWAVMSDRTYFMLQDKDIIHIGLDFNILKFVYSLQGIKLITRAEARGRGLIQ